MAGPGRARGSGRPAGAGGLAGAAAQHWPDEWLLRLVDDPHQQEARARTVDVLERLDRWARCRLQRRA